jgi:hypothetical protein
LKLHRFGAVVDGHEATAAQQKPIVSRGFRRVRRN